ncbi:MAG: site-specific integrase [bacterium]|nr:site-specific integrase [bacterium]
MGRREGQIEDKGPGKWRLRWSTGWDPVKKRYTKTSETFLGTKRQAESRLRLIQKSLEDTSYVEPSRITLGEHIEEWLASPGLRNKVSERTLHGMGLMLRKHVIPVLGQRKLQKIGNPQVQNLIDGLSDRAGKALSPRTHQVVRRLLSQAFSRAIRQQRIAHNPAADIELPRRRDGDHGRQDERRSLTVAELRAFLSASQGTRFDVLWYFMAATGCRPGEALAVTWQDLDDETHVTFRQAVSKDGKSRLILAPTKTRKTRRIPLPQSVIDALAAHKVSQSRHILGLGPNYDRSLDLIFPNEHGGLMSPDNLRTRHFVRIAEKAGIELRKGDGPYVLRHTVVSQLLLHGEAPQTVAERVGDTVETIMSHYAHAVPRLQAGATETIDRIAFGD